jgi:hypothetical protein
MYIHKFIDTLICTFLGSSSRGIIVKDRVCRIDIAVDRDSAQRLKSDNKSAIANDKRNMYLANEGLIVGKGEESAGMSEDDRSKRQKAQSEKRKKLLNPLFFVSAHRYVLIYKYM